MSTPKPTKTPFATIAAALAYARKVGGNVEHQTDTEATVMVKYKRFDFVLHQGVVYQRDHPTSAVPKFLDGCWVAGPWLLRGGPVPQFDSTRTLLSGKYSSYQTDDGYIHELMVTTSGDTYWRVISPPRIPEGFEGHD